MSSTDFIVDTIEFLKVPHYKNKFVLHQKYVTEGLSMRQIARDFLSSKSTIRDYLLKFGIPLRSPRKHHSNPSRLNYGTRKISRNVIPHLGEHRVIEAIMDMHSKGLSLNSIATFLTKIGVPTKKRGKKWDHKLVQRIILRNVLDEH